MAFFSNELVGTFQSSQMRGTLNGAVTRSGNVITLNHLTLTLVTATMVYGNKTFTFTLNGTATTFNISIPSATPTKNLGTFSISSTGFTAQSDEWYRTVYWSTSDGASGSFTVTFAVAPTKPTVTSAGTGFRSISVTYGTTSFGLPATGSVKLYGGTTASPTTQIDSYDQTGTKTFTLTNVPPSTTYYFRARAANSEKSSSYSSDVTITSKADPKFLGSANGKAVRIKKMYCSVDGKTKNMKFYGSVSGVTKRIF